MMNPVNFISKLKNELLNQLYLIILFAILKCILNNRKEIVGGNIILPALNAI